MVRTAISRSGVVVSVGLLAACAGSAWGNPDTLQPPPGPITGTYKTLTEVEPRIIVNARNTPGNATSTFVISQTGSYYLDQNLSGELGKVGIRVLADNVTLDLNGFTLTGLLGASDGIVLVGARPVVRNGQIRNWPRSGIAYSGLGGQGGVYRDLVVSGNGVSGVFTGMDLRDDSYVTGCVAAGNTGFGIRVATGSYVLNNRFSGNTAGGILAFDSSRIENNEVTFNSGNSIELGNSGGGGCFVMNNTVRMGPQAAARGMTFSGNDHVITDNTIVGANAGSSQGMVGSAGATGLVLRGNIVKNTADNYALLAGGNNQYDLLLSQVPETIDVPANVKLTGSLTAAPGVNGITVTSDNVNIDLGGHTLTGSGFSSGIVTTSPERRAISIANGTIRGFANGVVLDASSTTSVRNVTVTGVEGRGIVANFVATVENCQVTGVGAQGIFVSNGSVVRNNVVSRAGTTAAAVNADGIFVGSDTLVEGNNVNFSGGDNIQTGSGSIVRNNTVWSAVGRGINAGDANLIENNSVRANASDGIAVSSFCRVARNNTNGNGGLALLQGGILVAGQQNEIVDNHMTGDDSAIVVLTAATRNFIARNTAGGTTSGLSYSISAGNAFGPIVNVAGVGNFNATANSTHPQANFDK